MLDVVGSTVWQVKSAERFWYGGDRCVSSDRSNVGYTLDYSPTTARSHTT
ncbi:MULTISPECIES: hypothetical protein [Kamptonema]|nr:MULTISPECIES: hypothetical protein [Kamptonema]